MEPRRFDTRADRPTLGESSGTGRAIVVEPHLRGRTPGGADARARLALRSPDAKLEEAVGLARAIDLTIVQSGVVPVGDIRPATFLGKGKVEEIAGIVKTDEAGIVVMDCALSPVQQRNLEKAWNAKVLDRIGLILEIFGRRAHTREGSLQVELAHLNYQKSRLVRSWTHLERQRGGFGFLGGPGESQLETDRRLIGERIARIESELEKVKRTRKLHRESRKRVPYPIVALVGYTNAGKSTLFNRLTHASVLSADMLFATLDPTLRAVDLAHGARVILSDTVGFISELPTMLVAAFRATLEEVIEADVILHVRDVSHEDTEAQSHDVADVLRQLGIEPEQGGHDRGVEQDRPARLKPNGRGFAIWPNASRGPAAHAGFGGHRRGDLNGPHHRDRTAAEREPHRAGPRARSGRRGRGELAAPPHRGDGESPGRGRPAGDAGAHRSGQCRAGARQVRSVATRQSAPRL